MQQSDALRAVISVILFAGGAGLAQAVPREIVASTTGLRELPPVYGEAPSTCSPTCPPVVVGNPEPDPIHQSPQPEPIPDPPDPGGGGDSGGGTEETPPPAPPACRATDSFRTNHYSDALGVKSANGILANADHARFEYGAIIYRDASGTIRSSELVRGVAGGIPQFPLQVMAALSVRSSAMLGIVHNHPGDTYNTALEKMKNRNPSDNDWATAAALVTFGADASMLQLYVLGPDDVFREFDFSKRGTYVFRERLKGPPLLVTGTVLPKDTPLPECPEAP